MDVQEMLGCGLLSAYDALLASFVLNGINQCERERIMRFRRFDSNVALNLILG